MRLTRERLSSRTEMGRSQCNYLIVNLGHFAMSPFRRRASRSTVKQPADPGAARSVAIGLLARRDYASGELRERLQRKGFGSEIVESTLAELVEERALDDTRYAGNYVSYCAARGQGPLRIAAELRALGLPSDLIEVALAAGPDWRALVADVRNRKFGPEPPADWPEKARQARFLQYRGFSSDHIRLALGADLDLD
jgi:regulatory protein